MFGSHQFSSSILYTVHFAPQNNFLSKKFSNVISWLTNWIVTSKKVLFKTKETSPWQPSLSSWLRGTVNWTFYPISLLGKTAKFNLHLGFKISKWYPLINDHTLGNSFLNWINCIEECTNMGLGFCNLVGGSELKKAEKRWWFWGRNEEREERDRGHTRGPKQFKWNPRGQSSHF